MSGSESWLSSSFTLGLAWVAAKELRYSYHTPEIILSTIYPSYGSLILAPLAATQFNCWGFYSLCNIGIEGQNEAQTGLDKALFGPAFGIGVVQKRGFVQRGILAAYVVGGT